jgi:hypothetical protein
MVDFDKVWSTHRLVINGVVIDDAREDVILDWVYDVFEGTITCPFCASSFRRVTYDDGEKEVAMVRVCENCAHWQCYRDSDEGRTWYGQRLPYHAGLSKLRDFDVCLPDGCVDEIVQHLRRAPALFHRLAPKEVECLVAAVFKANYAASEVIHVGKPGDGGVDVVFVDSGKTQWLIQVKARQRDGLTEGVGLVRSLLGTMVLQDAVNGILVSTADHFTYRALEAVGRAREAGFTIRLVDKGILSRMMSGTLPDRPWLTFFAEYPHLQAWFETRIPSRRQLRLFD